MSNNKNFVVKNGLDVGLNVTANTFIGDLTGNADTATTLATSRTIGLGGDLSGSASFDGSSDITITATVSDDSHNHTIANIDGLQNELDGKLDSSDVGTTVLAHDGNLQSFVDTFTLPTSDGANNQVLTTDGAGNVTFEDVSNPLDLYAENPDNPTAPSATGTNAVAIGFNAQATNSDAVAIGENAYALGVESFAIGTQTDAFSIRDCAFGYNAQAIGGYSVAIGNSRTGGNYAFAAAIANNSASYGATGPNSIAIGQLAKATAANSIAIGDAALSNTANLIALGGTTDTVQISGAYALPTTDGANNQVLTTDGAGNVTFEDVSNPLDLYAENPDNPTAPSATGLNSVAIGSNASATGTNAMSLGNFSSATETTSSSFGYNADATQRDSLALGAASRARAIGAVAIRKSSAYGEDSFAAVIDSNITTYGATGANSVAIGRLAKATATGATAFGDSNIASGDYAAVFGENNTTSGFCSFTAGQGNNNSGNRGIALGNGHSVSSFYTFASGSQNIASENYCTAIGSDSVADKQGKLAHGSGGFGAGGDAQYGRMVLAKATTDATPIALTSITGNPANDTNQVILPNNSAYAFHGTIVARQQAADGTDCAAWKIEGLIRREGSAGTTVLVNSIINTIDDTPGWSIDLSADTTNGGLKIEVTGAASTNIRWVATVHTSEVSYS